MNRQAAHLVGDALGQRSSRLLVNIAHEGNKLIVGVSRSEVPGTSQGTIYRVGNLAQTGL
jgi:hypothetical protein